MTSTARPSRVKRSTNPLNICSFNARSLRNKIAEISYFTSTNDIHVLAVSETWLDPSISDTSININGFQTPFRKDRNKFGGGVCVYISNKIPCRRRENYETDSLELIWVELFDESNRSLLIGCCYRPPSAGRIFYNLLETNLNGATDCNILLLGDFNAKHSDWYENDCTNFDGTALKDLLDSFDLTQLCSKPTHLSNDGRPQSLLDLVITNRPDCFNSLNVQAPLSTSDHLPITVRCVFTRQSHQETCATGSPIWLFHKKDRDAMLSAFRRSTWVEICSCEDMDTLWAAWKAQFFREISSFLPQTSHHSRKAMHKNSRNQQWFSDDLRHQIVLKNRSYRRALRTRNPEDWLRYRTIRNKTANAIKYAKYAFFQRKASLLAEPDCPPSTWWSTVRNMCGFNSSPSHAVPPLLDTDTGNHVTEDSSKAELFNHVFINQNTSLQQSPVPFGPTTTRSAFTMNIVSQTDVSRVLCNLPNKLSSGADGISYRLLREAGPGVVMPLVDLFNKSIALGSVPAEWRSAVVTPIFKGGRKDRRLPANYRPIALTSCVARVLEKLINKKLLKYLLENKLIYEHQSGFLPCHSTITQLCFLLHRWQMSVDRREVVQAAFLDLSKAYDRVPTLALVYKLSRAGLSPATLKWFSSFLTSRNQCVRVNGERSSWQLTRSGIPQGSVLGPTLFLIFINDLPSCIKNDCSIFADDTTVYSTGQSRNIITKSLSPDMDRAAHWASSWGMLYNAEKSEVMTISKAKPPTEISGTNNEEVTMNGAELPSCRVHKHLGVLINSSLTWGDHINEVYTKCARQTGALRKLRGKVTRSAIEKIYKGFIQPRLEYACAVWSGGNTTKLRRLHERFCRHFQVNLPPLQQRFSYHTLLLFFKIRMKISPEYLSAILPDTLSNSSRYSLRRHVYPVPRLNKVSTYADFFPRAIILWNTLPSSIQNSPSVHSFKSRLREYLRI